MDNFGATQQMSVQDKTMMTGSPNSQATLLGTPAKCPVCGTENSPTEKYCGECGFLMSGTPGAEVAAAEAQDQVRLIDSADQRESYLRQGENTVGRESADVLVSHPTVSRRHALIVVDGGKCSVEDLGSTNGTFVGSKQVQPNEKVEVTDGDELRFGSASLIVKLPALAETEQPAEESPVVEETPVEVEASQEETAEVQSEANPEIEAEAASAETEAPPARLVSVSGTAREFSLKQGTNTIGRRLGNDIMISDDPYVSGTHADIVLDELGIWLVDDASTNGTMLNGTKIMPHSRMALNANDEIIFGRTTLKFELPDTGEKPLEQSDGTTD